MNLKIIGNVFRSKFVGTGPSSYKKKEFTGPRSHKASEALLYIISKQWAKLLFIVLYGVNT